MTCPPTCPNCDGSGVVTTIDYTGVTAEPCPAITERLRAGVMAHIERIDQRAERTNWRDFLDIAGDRMPYVGCLVFVALIAYVFVLVVTS